MSRRVSLPSADFVVVIDKSRSMTQTGLWPAVQKALLDLVPSIPDGDYLSLLWFGETCGYLTIPTPVNASTRKTLDQALRRSLEPRDNYTDLGCATERLLDELHRPGGSRIKFVFILSDFIHTPPPASRYYRRLDPQDPLWQALTERRQREQKSSILQVFALLLPLAPRVGRDLALVKAVFPELEAVSVNRDTLLPWFERRKAEIARDKLRLLVREDMERPPFTLEGVDVPIPPFQVQGPLRIRIRWTPDRVVSVQKLTDLRVNFRWIEDAPWLSWNTPQKGLVVSPERANGGEQTLRLGSVRGHGGGWVRRFRTLHVHVRIEGIQHLEPGDEMERLNLPARKPFEVEGTLAVRVARGRVPPWLLLVAGTLVTLAVGGVMWHCRPEYLVGEINVIGHRALRLRRSDRRKVLVIGNVPPGEGLPLQGVRWRLTFQATGPCRGLKRPRGVYVRLEGALGGRLVDARNQSQALGPDWVPVSRGSRVEIDQYQIFFN